MGCTASKLDNEDTVRRRKERRRLMKEIVFSRHHLAATHSDYCLSLRVTGAALTTFAAGEPLLVSHHTPAVLLRTPSSSTTTTTHKAPTFTHPTPPQPPSPTPPPSFHSSHHKKQPPPPPPPRRRNLIKLPHILSDSSFTSSPPRKFTYDARANSTYSSTPSQASSVWNWDNFYPPPSPPASEYFHNLNSSKKNASHVGDESDDGYTNTDFDDKGSSFSSYSNVRGGQVDQYHNPFGGIKESHKQFDDKASSYSRDTDNRSSYNAGLQGGKKGQNN